LSSDPAGPAPRVGLLGAGLLGAIVGWSVRHRAWVLASVFLLAIAALIVARELELDALPDVTGNQVVVLTQAPGLTPSEIERTVTRPIEVAVGGLAGLVEQRSLSRYGISSVTAVFEDDVDPWLARQQVAERISTLDDLPEGVERPELAPYTGGLGEVVQLAVRSRERSPAALYEIIQLQLAPALRATPGVVEVNIWGGARRTLEVVADPIALAQAGVSLDQLAVALGESTGAVAAAQLDAGPGQALLRAVHWPTRAAELGAVTLESNRASALIDSHADAAGETHRQTLRVAELAEVREGSSPRIGAATANGTGEVVYVMIQMQREANALALTKRIQALMPALEQLLPSDVEIDVVYDRSVLVEATLRTVAINLLEGAALVVLVLLVLLGSVRAGLLVAAVIPLAMLGALAGMVSFRVPGNLMSLGAIDFGLLVDGAVVMVERAFHELRGHVADARNGPSTSDDPRRSAEPRMVAAMQSVARPMALSVLIIMLVYVPILSLEGVDGKMFRPMALTVVFALLTSLVLALTYAPAAASLLDVRHLPRREPRLVRAATAIYEPILRSAIAHPGLLAFIAIALLGAGGLAFARSGTSFIPQLDEGDLVIQSTRAPDISLDTAIVEAGKLEAAVLTVPEVVAATSRIGSPEVATDIMGIEQADIFVELLPREQWRAGLSREQLIAEVDAAIAEQAPGADPAYTQPIQMRFNELLGGSVADVAVSVYGEDPVQLRAAAEQLETLLSTIAGAQDVRILAPPDVSLIEVRPNLLEASSLHMSALDVLDLVVALRVGVEVGETWDGPVRVPIRLHLAHEVDAFTLADVPVTTPAGEVVPLSRIADLHSLETPALVNRHSGQRRIIVGFNVRGADLGDVVVAARAKVDAQFDQSTGVRLVWGGQYEQLEHARERLAVVVPIVLVSVFALLLVVFRRFAPAALIFLNVPFAGVGGALALWGRAMPISISAAIGFIALSGIAVLNGVILMSSVTAREEAGEHRREAAAAAARERMRPVLMTALVAALGFVPMALATGVGAEVQRPLATVVVGGLLTSTFLTLVLLPALYPWLKRG
jgi:cobalt-zinc-cadmium resistance protein CzcA